MLQIDVVYALAEQQQVIALTLPDGATVQQAIDASGILQQHPAIDLQQLGLFSRPVTLRDRLHDGDRVEIYRPLQIDPKQARRLRAERSTS